MVKIRSVSLMSFVLLLSSCSGLNYRYTNEFKDHFTFHYSGEINTSIDNQHIHYKNRKLSIDDNVIDLPNGESLYIHYKRRDESTSYIVKVDSKAVKEVALVGNQTIDRNSP